MNWIGNHPLAGQGETIPTPLSSNSATDPEGSHEGWVSARVEIYRFRRELIQRLLAPFTQLFRRMIIHARWLRIIRR